MLTKVAQLHDEMIETWERGDEYVIVSYTLVDDVVVNRRFAQLIAANHRHNYNLWQLENEARRPDARDTDLARTKRAIDFENQLRNNAAQRIDEWLTGFASHHMIGSAILHSESPGLMIDRLSILALKTFYVEAQLARADAPPGHTEKAQARLEILNEQRGDLSRCLGEFWEGVMKGERRFKTYRQLKMYNDPAWNPAIYAAEGKR